MQGLGVEYERGWTIVYRVAIGLDKDRERLEAPDTGAQKGNPRRAARCAVHPVRNPPPGGVSTVDNVSLRLRERREGPRKNERLTESVVEVEQLPLKVTPLLQERALLR